MLEMLCLTSGCFFASTSFLPSSFSLYAISLASGLFLVDKPAAAVPVFATGLLLGWPLSILAFLLSDNFLFIKKVQASIYCWGCDLNYYSGIINTYRLLLEVVKIIYMGARELYISVTSFDILVHKMCFLLFRHEMLMRNEINNNAIASLLYYSYVLSLTLCPSP